jgi:hypothetical protein
MIGRQKIPSRRQELIGADASADIDPLGTAAAAIPQHRRTRDVAIA